MKQLEYFQSLSLDPVLLNKPSQNHQRRTYIRTFITKELLEELVYKNKFSIYHICNEIFSPKGYKTTADQLIKLCREFEIKTLSCKEQGRNKFVRNKFKQTCLSRYGKENTLSKGAPGYIKRNEVVKERYGVSNILQLPEIMVRARATMLEKYGVTNSLFLVTNNRQGRRSKCHRIIEKYLKSIKVPFRSEKEGFSAHNRILGRNLNPRVDILIKSLRLVIEVNGDYWHGNPKVYKPTDLVKKWKGHAAVSDIWEYDRIRIEQIESFGYTVLILWERDINTNFEYVKQLINEKCKNKKNKKNKGSD